MIAASEVGVSNCAVITDSNVDKLYSNILISSLEKSGYKVSKFVFDAGEQSKNANTFVDILEFLANSGLTRSDCVFALGGGVVGDIAGFAASVYLRGIKFVQIPTTLLAAVDSSVGGKTAVNLPAGKNLVGAFHQPSLVLCDLDTLDTLPESVFQDGCAEVIKYGVIYDAGLFSHLAENGLAFEREYVISRCVELKRNVVEQDEFDTGARQMLNYGHTIGHGIEAQSGFSVTHGQAVAIGMAIVSRASHCPDNDRIVGILKKFLAETALLGSQVDDLTIVKGDAQFFRQTLADLAAAAAVLTANGNNQVFHENIPAFLTVILCSFYGFFAGMSTAAGAYPVLR